MPIPFEMDPIPIIKWEKKLPIFPKKCSCTGKRIWLRPAYRATLLWTGPGDAIYEYLWVTPESYLFGTIRGDLKTFPL